MTKVGMFLIRYPDVARDRVNAGCLETIMMIFGGLKLANEEFWSLYSAVQGKKTKQKDELG